MSPDHTKDDFVLLVRVPAVREMLGKGVSPAAGIFPAGGGEDIVGLPHSVADA